MIPLNVHTADTSYNIGPLGGGGFVTDIQISSDGLTRIACCDTYGAWIYNSGTAKWDQLFSHDRVPAAYKFIGSGTGGNCPGCYAIAFAPSSPTTLYAFANVGSGTAQSHLWKSTDRGATWTDTGQTTAVGGADERLNGPKLAVDPNNANVVYWGNGAGIWFRSFDGGTTLVDGGPISGLLGALATANTNATTSNNVLHFASTPALVSGFSSLNFNTNPCAYDSTTPSAFGDGITTLTWFAADSTTVSLNNSVNSTVGNGDTIYFGSGPSICFDPTSTTGSVTINGHTATVTQGIYVGWTWGASKIYQSTNGGSTFSALAGTTATSVQHMVCSNDGVIYICDNTPTGAGAINTQNTWRYTTPTTTNTGSLAANTWTHLASTNPSGNSHHCVAFDPVNAGHVTFIGDSGGFFYSTDYGTTISGSGAGSRVATDAPWLANTVESFMGSGNCFYDTQVSGRLWFAQGIGIWYANPSASASSITYTSQTVDENQLIVDKILKVPGGPILICVQDRQLMIINDVSQYPKANYPHANYFTGFIDDGSGNGTYSGIAGNTLTITSAITGIGGTQCTISGTVLTVGGTVDGGWGNGVAVVGVGVPAGLTITTNGTGTGGAGTYNLSGSATISTPQQMNGIKFGTFCYLNDLTNNAVLSNTQLVNTTTYGSGNQPRFVTATTQAASQLVPSCLMGATDIQIVHGWSCDYAKNDPTFLALVVGNGSGSLFKSTNSGQTWTMDAQNVALYGMVAVQTSTSMVWFAIDNNGNPDAPRYYDGSWHLTTGTSWTTLGAHTLPAIFNLGWSGDQYNVRNVVQADKVNGSKFFAYNGSNWAVISVTVSAGGSGYAVNDTITLASSNGNPYINAVVKVTGVTGSSVTSATVTSMGDYQLQQTGTISQSSTSGAGTGATFTAVSENIGGLWMSVNGGANWTQQSVNFVQFPTISSTDGSSAETLETVPGHEGHLFWCMGVVRNTITDLKFSSNNGANWSNVGNVAEANLVACGKSSSSSGYPSIFLFGRCNGDSIKGFYRCDNFDPANPTSSATTWFRLSQSAAGSLDVPYSISGDLDTYGTHYIGTSASGYIYGKI